PWNGPTTAATRAGTSHPNSTITYNMRQRRRDQAQTPTREKSRLGVDSELCRLLENILSGIGQEVIAVGGDLDTTDVDSQVVLIQKDMNSRPDWLGVAPREQEAIEAVAETLTGAAIALRKEMVDWKNEPSPDASLEAEAEYIQSWLDEADRLDEIANRLEGDLS
ncbi:hypothetical protein, partial [Brevibacterium moorei]|uniref:hypothetical protein n=1 Tax=Brevibacterium moorei TaxID=2968457 RepID=UPI00211C19D9